MTLAQRVPELDAALEPREASQTVSEEQGNGARSTQKTEAQKSAPGGDASSASST